MKLDIEEIRQSPRAFVDLETVILLSDRVMALEMKLEIADALIALDAMLKCRDANTLRGAAEKATYIKDAEMLFAMAEELEGEKS